MFFGQVPFDDLVITGPNLTKFAWMLRLMIPLHWTGVNANSKLKVSDAELN